MPTAESGSEPQARAPGVRSNLAPLARILVVVAIVVALMVFGRGVVDVVPRFAQWVDGLGAWGPVAFVVGYAAAVVAFVPGSVLTLAAGAIFGLVEGTLLVLVGATLGSTAAFLLARTVARDAVARRIEGDARFAAIDRAIGREGFRITLLLRLSPVFPFSLLNYVLGLTRVGLRDYVTASVGMIPGTLLYVYSGRLAGELATLAGGAAPPRGAGYWAVVTLGFAATILVTVIVTRIARRALAQATEA